MADIYSGPTDNAMPQAELRRARYGNAASGVGGALIKTPSQSPFDEQSEVLNKKLHVLSEVVLQLQGRLGPVLMPTDGAERTQGVAPAHPVALVDVLCRSQAHVDDITDAVRGIIERLVV